MPAETEKYGARLRRTLERSHRAVNNWPFHQQRRDRTWKRHELLQSGMDLEREALARKRAARQMDPARAYTQQEIEVLCREWREKEKTVGTE